MELLSTSKIAEVKNLQDTLNETIKANEQNNREYERLKAETKESKDQTKLMVESFQ